MKIFSWNINGLRAVENRGSLEAFLNEKQPDIACFQETKIQAAQVEALKLDEKYPEYKKFYSFAERKGYSGTAIWSKIEPIQILHNFSPEILAQFDLTDNFGDTSTEGRICAAEFDEFWLVTVYTPNSKGDLGRLAIRQNWDKAFLEFIKQLEKQKPVVFCGDMNVAHQEIDLKNPKSNRGKHGFTDEERFGFGEFLNNNFVDIYRAQNPETTDIYTWWSHFAKSRERNVGWRIDYFVLSASFPRENIVAKIFPEVMGSDHCPVSIEITE
ncbi:MAG: exodeoxyribonuclease III [Candidatus Sacchiramonaceae bacterium]|nr:exodeoxyribonuclease III [Candidatus Saccharimonadaceae bacterium]